MAYDAAVVGPETFTRFVPAKLFHIRRGRSPMPMIANWLAMNKLSHRKAESMKP